MIPQYTAKNLRVDGTKVTLDVEGFGTLTADFIVWDDLLGDESNISKVKLLDNEMLEFPNDIHIEIDDFVTLAKEQIKSPPISARVVNALKDLV